MNSDAEAEAITAYSVYIWKREQVAQSQDKRTEGGTVCFGKEEQRRLGMNVLDDEPGHTRCMHFLCILSQRYPSIRDEISSELLSSK